MFVQNNNGLECVCGRCVCGEGSHPMVGLMYRETQREERRQPENGREETLKHLRASRDCTWFWIVLLWGCGCYEHPTV